MMALLGTKQTGAGKLLGSSSEGRWCKCGRIGNLLQKFLGFQLLTLQKVAVGSANALQHRSMGPCAYAYREVSLSLSLERETERYRKRKREKHRYDLLYQDVYPSLLNRTGLFVCFILKGRSAMQATP